MEAHEAGIGLVGTWTHANLHGFREPLVEELRDCEPARFGEGPCCYFGSELQVNNDDAREREGSQGSRLGTPTSPGPPAVPALEGELWGRSVGSLRETA